MRAPASSLLPNAETRIVYRQESDQLGSPAAGLGLTGTEQSLLPTLGTGQGLWRIKNRSFSIHAPAPSGRARPLQQHGRDELRRLGARQFSDVSARTCMRPSGEHADCSSRHEHRRSAQRTGGRTPSRKASQTRRRHPDESCGTLRRRHSGTSRPDRRPRRNPTSGHRHLHCPRGPDDEPARHRRTASGSTSHRRAISAFASPSAASSSALAWSTTR